MISKIRRGYERRVLRSVVIAGVRSLMRGWVGAISTVYVWAGHSELLADFLEVGQAVVVVFEQGYGICRWLPMVKIGAGSEVDKFSNGRF